MDSLILKWWIGHVSALRKILINGNVKMSYRVRMWFCHSCQASHSNHCKHVNCTGYKPKLVWWCERFHVALSLKSCINITDQYRNKKYFIHIWLLDLPTGLGMVCVYIYIYSKLTYSKQTVPQRNGEENRNSMNCLLYIISFIRVIKRDHLQKKKKSYVCCQF